MLMTREQEQWTKAAYTAEEQENTKYNRLKPGLRGKMVAAMTAAALLPLLLFAGVMYYYTSKSLYREAGNRISRAANSLSVQVSEWYELTLRAATITAQLPDIKTMQPEKQLPLLKAVNSQFPWLYNIKIHDASGMAIARSDEKKLKNYSDRRYFQEAMAGKHEVWQTLIGKTSKKATLVLAAPVYNNDTVVGVSVAAGTIDKVRKWIAEWKDGRTGYACIIEPNGKVIVHPDNTLYENQVNLADKGHPLARMFRENRTGALQYTRDDGVEMYGYVAETPMGWGVIVEQELDEVFQLVHLIAKTFLGFLIGGIIIACIMGVVFSSRITRPIIYLTEVTRELSLGRLNASVKVNASYEINQLADAISRLQSSLIIAMRRLKRHK